jgi:hypothetical protein
MHVEGASLIQREKPLNVIVSDFQIYVRSILDLMKKATSIVKANTRIKTKQCIFLLHKPCTVG